MVTMDDLTKLSGPELADRLAHETSRGCGTYVSDLGSEAARRLREDTREWQRRLERERDGLRAELAQCKATMAGMHEARGELQRELDAERERNAELDGSLKYADDVAKDALECAETRLKRIAELEAQLREALHGKSYGYPVTTKAEPAERKAQEERRYGPYEYTLDKVCQEHGHTRTLHDVFRHLRETLATLDAVRALADGWAVSPGLASINNRSAGRELREVLNGKR